MESATTCCFVEARRTRRSQFREHQLLRTLNALNTYARDRTPLLLLVTAEAAPFPVHNLGRASIIESVEHSLTSIPDPQEQTLMRRLAMNNTVATTWARISDTVANRSRQVGPLGRPCRIDHRSPRGQCL